MSILKLLSYLIKVIFKKIYQRNLFNNPRWFPINKNGSKYEGFNNPIFSNEDGEGYFVRFYKTDFKNLNFFNFVLNYSKDFFFKFEVLKGKIYSKNFRIKTSKECLLPIAATNNYSDTIEVDIAESSKKIGLLSNKFTYIKLKGNKEYNFNFKNNFVVGNPIETESQNDNKYNLVLMIFLDGLTLPNDSTFDKFCPNIQKFFNDGVKFKNNFCNAEWTLPSFPSHFTGLRQQNHGFYHNKKFHIFRNDTKVLSELFKEKNYLNLFLNSNPRANPKYGYVRGFDRTIHKLNYEFEDMCNDLDEHLSVFIRRDNFIMMNVFDLHATDKNFPPFENQANLELDYLSQYVDREENKKTPLKEKKYTYNKIEIEKYLANLKKIDRVFLKLLDIIKKHFPKGKSLVTIVTDHGNQYTESTHDLLSQNRMRVPWLIKGDGLKPSVVNDFTENVDSFASMIKLCNLSEKGNINAKFKNHFTGENNTDSILPKIFGGLKQREFVFMQSIYDNDPYFAKILDSEMEFIIKSQKIDRNGSIDLKDFKKEVKLFTKNKSENIEKLQKYEKFCTEQVNNWNESVVKNKFEFYDKS